METESIIRKSFENIPSVEGPIEVTENSHPFCAMKYSRTPLDVAEYGYVEEEYFLSGLANIYDTDEKDRAIVLKSNVPYKTRILVRRPKDKEKYSGRVYVDIMNATQGYDIEDLWHRGYLWCMENGHAYVGITSKPVNVLALKNFDYERYSSLNWSNGELVPAPVISKSATIPGTEEGLIWDMLGQLGNLLRRNENNCLGGYRAEYIYLTGQSQSGAYLNTFVHYFDLYTQKGDSHRIFDGYLNVVGALVQRSIRQEDTVGPLKLSVRNMRPCATPYICMSSEADLYLFNLFLEGNLFEVKIENSNTEENKCRYYEIPGSPHTDIVCPVLTAVSEIEKMDGKLPNLDAKLLAHINDMHVEYYICGLLEKLHNWAAQGIAPEISEPMERMGEDLARDSFGNAKGGFRTPYVDVPIATYVASNPDDPEGICGKMEYFTLEMVEKLYGSEESYLSKFREYTVNQQKEGWLSKTDANKLISWSEKAIKRLRK